MKRITHPERRRRFIDAFKKAAVESRILPQDPGLREAYTSIPKLPIRLICSPMGKVINHGGLLRIAEAFRIELITFAKEASDESDHPSRVHCFVCSSCRGRGRPQIDPAGQSERPRAGIDRVHSRLRRSRSVLPGVDGRLPQLRPYRKRTELFEHRNCLPAGPDPLHDPKIGLLIQMKASPAAGP